MTTKQIIFNKTNKDRSTDHQEQQAHEADADNSQTISPGSVVQRHNDRYSRGHSKTDLKPDIYKQNSHQQ